MFCRELYAFVLQESAFPLHAGSISSQTMAGQNPVAGNHHGYRVFSKALPHGACCLWGATQPAGQIPVGDPLSPGNTGPEGVVDGPLEHTESRKQDGDVLKSLWLTRDIAIPGTQEVLSPRETKKKGVCMREGAIGGEAYAYDPFMGGTDLSCSPINKGELTTMGATHRAMIGGKG